MCCPIQIVVQTRGQQHHRPMARPRAHCSQCPTYRSHIRRDDAAAEIGPRQSKEPSMPTVTRRFNARRFAYAIAVMPLVLGAAGYLAAVNVLARVDRALATPGTPGT